MSEAMSQECDDKRVDRTRTVLETRCDLYQNMNAKPWADLPDPNITKKSLNSVGHWKDTDEIIKSQQGADDFFVSFHDNVNSWTDTFVHQLYKEKNDRLENL